MAYITKIYGPPGTGKTRTLLDFFETQLKKHGVPPNRIAFLTFTRAARLEALGRTGLTEEDLPFVRTIHAMCYRQLGVTQSQLVRKQDLREFSKITGTRIQGVQYNDPWELQGYLTTTAPTRDDKLLQINHLGRHRLVHLRDGLIDADVDIDYKYAKWFTESYRTWKTQEALLDYTDILTEYLKYGKPLPIDVMFVDEAQDLSKLQWQVIQKLGANANFIFLAGDDDQTIFEWAGASAEAFITEPSDEQLYLERSNRVPGAVVAVARDIISRINVRAEKPWLPKEGWEGEVRTIPYIDPEHLKDESTFILFRNHHRGLLIKEELEAQGIPFVGENSILSDRRVQAVLKAWVDFHTNNVEINSQTARAVIESARDDVLNKDMIPIIRKDSTRTWKYVDIFKERHRPTEFFRVLSKIPGIDYLYLAARNFGFNALLQPKVTLLSIHQSKGREASTVILDLEMARKTFDSWFQSPDAEHRVWYVGVTRAMNRLLTLIPEGTMSYPL